LECSVRCSNCGADVPEGKKLCQECGSEQPDVKPPKPKSRFAKTAWIGAVAIVAFAVALTAYLANSGPGAAVAELSSAVRSGDDVAVANMFVPTLRTGFLLDRTEGASRILTSRLPNIGSMELRKVASDEAWLLDPGSPDVRLVLRKSDGWRIASVSYSETETVEEPLSFAETVNETTHLPRGTRIVIAPSVAGRVRKTIKVLSRDGREVSRSETNREVLAQPTTGEVYVGTGTRGSGVSRLVTGSRFKKKENRVTNSSSRLSAKDGKLGASWRITNPRTGDRDRLVLLGPGGDVEVGDNSKLSGKYDWYDSLSYFSMQGGSAWNPTGKWIVVVEKNNRPAAWRAVTVE
jgi:hypothetical protein